MYILICDMTKQKILFAANSLSIWKASITTPTAYTTADISTAISTAAAFIITPAFFEMSYKHLLQILKRTNPAKKNVGRF